MKANTPTQAQSPDGARCDPGAIQDRITTVAASLRNALREVIEGIGGHPTRPVALARALGIDKKLAGRVLAATMERDPLAVAYRLPAPQGLRMFLAALKGKVPPQTAAQAEEHVRGFETLIAQDAGDRAALDAMISGWMPDVRERGERARKQAVFKGLSYLLGYQVETKLATLIVQPSESDEGACDELALYGCCGLQRLRPGSPVVVALISPSSPEASAARPRCFETLAGDHVPGQYVLEEFSTSPLPRLTIHKEGNVIRHVLGEGGLGPNGGVTLMFVSIGPGTVARYRRSDRREEVSVAIQHMPCKVLIQDVFIRDDVWPRSHPKLTTSMLRLFDPSPPGKTSDMIGRLESSETIQSLGKGTSGIHTKEVDNYAKMVNCVFDKVGWPRERFRAYRMRVQYPIPYMCYAMWFDLPSKPGD